MGFIPRQNCARHSYISLSGEFPRTSLHLDPFLVLNPEFSYLSLVASDEDDCPLAEV
jgi:hypothetical protein